MLNFKTFLIALAITFLILTGFVNSSDAFEIEEMYPSGGGYEDYRGYLYHTAYVKTSEPYTAVDWYITDVQSGEDWSYAETDMGDGVKTEAYFSPNTSDFPGCFQGQIYTITAKAWGNASSDVDSYRVTVYTQSFDPMIDAHIGENTGVYGEATVWYMGWAGRTATLWMTAGGTNNTDNNVPLWIKLDYQVIEIDENGHLVSRLFRPTAIFLNFRLGTGEKDGRSKSDEYTLASGDWVIDKMFRVEGTATAYAGNEPRGEDNDKWEVSDGVNTTIRF